MCGYIQHIFIRIVDKLNEYLDRLAADLAASMILPREKKSCCIVHTLATVLSGWLYAGTDAAG